MELKEILEEQTMEIVNQSTEALNHADLKPYKKSLPEENRDRFLTLVKLLIQSVDEKTLLPMKEYGAKIAHERHQKGYSLDEVFTAFSVLEETIWKCVMDHSECERHGKYLGLVGTIMSRGKESLALTYVDLAVENPNPIRDYNALLSRM